MKLLMIRLAFLFRTVTMDSLPPKQVSQITLRAVFQQHLGSHQSLTPHFYASSVSFIQLYYNHVIITNILPDFFSMHYRYWADFWYGSLSCWVTENFQLFLPELKPLNIYNKQFFTLLSRLIQILNWFLVCLSTLMSYRSS